MMRCSSSTRLVDAIHELVAELRVQGLAADVSAAPCLAATPAVEACLDEPALELRRGPHHLPQESAVRVARVVALHLAALRRLEDGDVLAQGPRRGQGRPLGREARALVLLRQLKESAGSALNLVVVITSTVEAMMASVAGLSGTRLARVRGRLEAFADEMFDGAIQRFEQRKWGGVYLRGLMLEGRRKSIEPIAARLEHGDEQCFVNQSPWDGRVVRRNLARRMTAELEPEAWIVDDTGFPKKGRFSVGVARQYSGTLGRIDNCQIGVSISAATDQASCPLDWRIYLPTEWDEDAERRRKAHVPDEVRQQPKWRLALDMIDELRGWRVTPPVVYADAGYGEITAFGYGLDERAIDYIVQVKAGTSAYPRDEAVRLSV
jgi:hypothetical protein